MTSIGSIQKLYRYPVKSMQGRSVERLDVRPAGAFGDRRWALLDKSTGKLMSAKRHSALLEATATDTGIELPDGTVVPFDAPDIDEILATWLNCDVTLRACEPGLDVEYEMTFDPPDDSADYYAIPAPKGTFLDAAALHLITTATLEGCRADRPDLDWDIRRFRPNVLVETTGASFIEDAWCGRHLAVGEVTLGAKQPTVRCAMPLRAQPGLHREPRLFEALDALHNNHLGIYLEVVTPGIVHVGDQVQLR